jgi:2-C-methyl-D-erythritol 2,4-cyclodiphosphate synthase
MAAMKANLAPILGLTPEDLNIKATTTEHMGFTGREEGIAAYAVALVQRVVSS